MTNNPVSPTISTLEELGLAKNEAILYDALLKTTDATIPYLLKTAPFSRTLLYYLLGNLEGYGLVTSRRASAKGGPTAVGKTVYSAEPPDKLADMLKDRENEFKKQKDLLGGIMGDLYSTYRLAHNKPGVKFYEGLNGVREALWDSLNAKDIIYTFVDGGSVDRYMAEMNVEYVKERVKRNINKQIITTDTPESRERDIDKERASLTKLKFIDAAKYPFKAAVQIYNDSVSYIAFTNQQPIAFLIKSEVVAQFHRSIFLALWHSLPGAQKHTPDSSRPAPSPNDAPARIA